MNYNNEFDSIVLNTKTMQVYIQIGAKKYNLKQLQTGENCIITTNKILDNYKLVGSVKSFKYANIFNADNQKLINHYLNS